MKRLGYKKQKLHQTSRWELSQFLGSVGVPLLFSVLGVIASGVSSAGL